MNHRSAGLVQVESARGAAPLSERAWARGRIASLNQGRFGEAAPPFGDYRMRDGIRSNFTFPVKSTRSCSLGAPSDSSSAFANLHPCRPRVRIADVDTKPFTPLPPEPRPGLYRHYKGNDYRVIGLARHSETLEPLVVYQALYGERGLWVRPAEMFCETVEVRPGGGRVPRFGRIGD